MDMPDRLNRGCFAKKQRDASKYRSHNLKSHYGTMKFFFESTGRLFTGAGAGT